MGNTVLGELTINEQKMKLIFDSINIYYKCHFISFEYGASLKQLTDRSTSSYTIYDAEHFRDFMKSPSMRHIMQNSDKR